MYIILMVHIFGGILNFFVLLLQFSQNIDGFRQNNSQLSLLHVELVKLYKQKQLELFLFFLSYNLPHIGFNVSIYFIKFD